MYSRVYRVMYYWYNVLNVKLKKPNYAVMFNTSLLNEKKKEEEK